MRQELPVSASGTLNLADYTTVWDHNFATQPNLDGFGTVWGDVTVKNGAAVITSSAANGWEKSGFMITPSGPSAGTGYGLYSITMSMNANGAVEGPGGYACLWPSSNNWPGPELDLVEKGDASSGTNGYSTIHWAGADGSNQFRPTNLGNIDVTQKHTYAMDWEPGRITLYVDGKEIYTTTQNVPADYAHGGENEAFGAGEEPAWAASQQGGNSINQVQVYDISYSAYTPGSGGSSASGAGTGTTDPNSSSTTTTGGSAAPVSAGTTTTGTNPNGSGGAASPSDVTYVASNPNPFFVAGDGQTVASGVSDQTIVLEGKGDILILGANNDSVLANNTGMTFYNEGHGTNNLYDLVGGNTFSIDPAGGTMLTWDNALSNGDKFDLRYALNASGWDGNTADLSQFLTDVHESWGMSLYVHPSGGSAATPVLDIVGKNANIDLQTFLQHAVV
jgi:hypothetical protein